MRSPATKIRLPASSELTIPGSTLDEIQRWAILETLKGLGGNKSETARVLGLDRRTLYRKLSLYQETPGSTSRVEDER